MFHKVENANDLFLEVQIFVHQLLTSFFIFNLMDKLSLIILLIKLLDKLINRLSSLKILGLKFLNVDEKFSFGHLELCFDENLVLWLLDQLCFNLTLIFYATQIHQIQF